MKSPAGTLPSCGCVQRTSASTPVRRREVASKISCRRARSDDARAPPRASASEHVGALPRCRPDLRSIDRNRPPARARAPGTRRRGDKRARLSAVGEADGDADAGREEERGRSNGTGRRREASASSATRAGTSSSSKPLSMMANSSRSMRDSVASSSGSGRATVSVERRQSASRSANTRRTSPAASAPRCRASGSN